MYTARTPKLVKALYHDLEWEIPGTDRGIFLTFDDGPIPEITPQVLEILDRYHAQATFFCIGDNVRKHPDIYTQLIAKGHAVGNHSYNHLKGWKTENELYFENVARCAKLVDSKLFRPPYGKITRSQSKILKAQYRIIMWSVLSGDFDPSISKEKCLENVIRNTKTGSVIVFHDSLKAAEKMLYALPKVLSHFSERGFKFLPIR